MSATPEPGPAQPDDVDDDHPLAAAYAALNTLLLEQLDVGSFLDRAAGLAAGVVPDVSCGITLQDGDDVGTVASSNDLAERLDEVQYMQGSGPCLDTLRQQQPFLVVDMREERRWGEYPRVASELGIRCSLGVPFRTDRLRGALNLYLPRPDGFGRRETERAEAFVRQLVTTLTVVLRHADRTTLEEQMRQAIVARAVIDQAVGIVMGQRRVNAAEAFEVLRTASQNSNLPMREVAARLVRSITGQAPVTPRPFADPR